MKTSMNEVRETFSRTLQLDSLHVRKPLWIALVIVVVLAVSLPLVAHLYLLRTEYAPGFSEAAFNSLQPGDTLDTVLQRLREPFDFVIVSQRQDGSQYRPEYLDDMSVLQQWAADETVVVVLRYSKAKRFDGDYRAREVWINKGRVKELRAYNYWD